MTQTLRNKAAQGCAIRIALADPAGPEVAQRDAEEALEASVGAHPHRARSPLRSQGR
jgi:hypothetical protein